MGEVLGLEAHYSLTPSFIKSTQGSTSIMPVIFYQSWNFVSIHTM